MKKDYVHMKNIYYQKNKIIKKIKNGLIIWSNFIIILHII